MWPEVFRIGPVPIRSYGLALAVAFFLGILYIYRLTQKQNKPFEPFLTISYIMIFGGIIGARVAYVLFHLSEFSGNWGATFNPFASASFGIAGLNVYGGVFLAIIGTFVYARWTKQSVLEYFDFFSPTFGLGLGIARIGCFFNGCCFGTPTDLAWGISFPPGSIPYSVFGGVHLHPAQLYSSIYGLGLFLLLHWMMSRRKFVGQLVAVMFMIEAFFRYVIEYVRYYEDAMHIDIAGMHPTYNHMMSIGLFGLGLTIYLIQQKRAKIPSIES